MEHKPKIPYPITIRVQALTMVTIGVDIKVVEASLGLSRQTFQYWVKKARERGYNPAVDFVFYRNMWKMANVQAGRKRLLNLLRRLSLNKLGKIQKGKKNLSKSRHLKPVSFTIFCFTHPEVEWLNAAKQTTNSGLANEMKQEQLMFALPKRIEPSRTGRMRCSRVKCLLTAAQVMFGV